jgi:hypothetical protein
MCAAVRRLHLGAFLEVDGFSQLLTEISGNLSKVRDGAFLEEALCVDQMTGDVGDEAFACGFVQNGVPEDCRLAEVVFVAGVVAVNFARDFVGLLQVADALLWLGTLNDSKDIN